MPQDIHYRSADGLKLYARAYGPADAAPAVLCMHGLTRNHKDFEPMIAALGPSGRFIAVDVRGRGRSAWDPDPSRYTPPVYVQDMAALLDHLGLQRVVLAGTSMGGLMAMLMMRTMPERIQGVILNDIGPEVDRKGLARIGGYAGKITPFSSWQEAAQALKAVQGPLFPAFDDRKWLDFARRTFRERDDGSIIADYDPAIAQSLGKVRTGPLARFLMWRLFSHMKKRPLLIVRGENSDILSPATLARMLRRHPDSQAVTVSGTGHAPILDEPEAVAAIGAFLKRFRA